MCITSSHHTYILAIERSNVTWCNWVQIYPGLDQGSKPARHGEDGFLNGMGRQN